MPELILIVVLAILVLALIGFVTLIRWLIKLFRLGIESTGDLGTARRVIDILKQSDALTDATYAEVRAAIQMRQAAIRRGPDESSPPYWSLPQVDPGRAKASDAAEPAGVDWVEAELAEQPGPRNFAKDVVPPVVRSDGDVPALAPIVARLQVESPPSSQPSSPWDLPNAEVATPRRSWREIFALFMQEKNIRWGELASGILIVGSAVGLVLSLRSQLLQVIPYFPALLFLLITAAIIASGIYTLRRWRLQMTSRGILVIGLLLIPLNILIGCWLTSSEQYQRPLTDPIYWIAITVELVSLAVLCWLAAKNLLRVWFAALVTAIIASSAYTLFINRLADPSVSALRTALWMMPFGAFFVFGVCRIAPRMQHRNWSGREIRRLQVNLGVTFFAVAVGLSLFFIKWPRFTTGVGIAPAATIIGATLVWLGGLFFARQRTPIVLWRVVSLSQIVLGFLLVVGSIVSAQIHPTLGLATAIVAGCAFIGHCYVSRSAWFTLPAMICVALATIAGVNLFAVRSSGQLGWDQFTTPLEFFRSLVSGRTGVSLLIVAGLMAVGSRSLVRRCNDWDARFHTFQFAILCGVAVFGALLAVAASVMFPDRQFDMQAATALLATIAVTLWATSIFRPLERVIAFWLPILAVGFCAGTLVHALWWNQVIADYVSLKLGSDSLASIGACLFSTISGLGTALLRQFGGKHLDDRSLNEGSRVYSSSSVFGSLATWALLFPVLNNESAVGTSIALVTCAVWMLLAISQNDPRLRAGFAVAFGVAALIFVAEFGQRIGWYGNRFSLEFVLANLFALGLWSLPWVWLRHFSKGNRTAALFDSQDYRPDTWVGTVVVVSTIGLIGIGLVQPVLAEIAGFVRLDPWPAIDLGLHQIQFGLLLGLGALAVLVVSLEKVTAVGLASLGWIWLGAFGLFATAFESSNACASGLRWLLAGGGFALSLLIALRPWLSGWWRGASRRIGFQPQIVVDEVQQTNSVYLWLIATIAVVMAITSYVAATALIFGGRGLADPAASSLFAKMSKDISYGVPIGLLVATCLSYAVSQRRSSLAMLGSGVFQFCVVGSYALLIASTNPAIASVRFIQILQVVLIGMSIYGTVWFLLREKISDAAGASRQTVFLQAHTLINLCLMLGLSGIIFFKFWTDGRITGDWARAMGGPGGIVAVALLIPLTIAVFPRVKRDRQELLVAAFGSILVAIAAIHIDAVSQWGVLSIGVGMAFVLALLMLAVWNRTSATQLLRLPIRGKSFELPTLRADAVPLILVGCVSVLFCARSLSVSFWPGYATLCTVLVIAMVFACRFLSGGAVLIACGLAVFNALTLWRNGAVVGFSPMLGRWQLTHLIGLSLLSVGLILVGFLLFRSNRAARMPPRFFTCWANLICVAASVGSAIYWLGDIGLSNGLRPGSTTWRPDPLPMAFLTASVALLGLQLWNVRARGVVPAAFFASVSVALFAVSNFEIAETRESVLVVLGAIAAVWGAARWYRDELTRSLRPMRIARPVSLSRRIGRQIPVLIGVLAVLIVPAATLAVFYGSRTTPQLMAGASLLLLSAACLYLAARPANARLQLATAILFTLTFLVTSWIGIPNSPNKLIVVATRSIIILSLAVFVFTVLIPRWSRPGDTWLRAFRQMILLTTTVGIGLLATLVFDAFVSDAIGRVLVPPDEAIGVFVAVLVLCGSLIAIAVRPHRDAFDYSVQLRTGFVYAAQFAGVLGIIHAMLSIPWLLNLGLREFWPYLLMAAAMGGILLAKLLERRRLLVLAQPIMNSAMTIPLAGAAGTLLTQTRTDSSLVMLMAGGVYLALSFVQRSLLAGLAALVFGNWALFCYYSRIPQFRFADHPQLWLIPPALSVLLAAQLIRRELSRGALASIRYAALGVIYVSSTSEIFIQGIGEQLWPPIILASLSLAGMFCGILIQIRSFLYVGFCFLLLSVVAMVSHAHRKFEHVWPWWAFGICSGVIILVLFGLFEKRRNEIRRVAAKLQMWDL